MERNAFHVVCQDILGNPHIAKGVDHANEEILLFRIGDELDRALTAVEAYHGEADCGVFCSVIVQNFCEASVQLAGFFQLGRVLHEDLNRWLV